jgi:uncharacterized protein with PQ loop repeat
MISIMQEIHKNIIMSDPNKKSPGREETMKTRLLKNIFIVGVGAVLVTSLTYHSIIQEYRTKDIGSLTSMIIGSIIIMSFLLFTIYDLSLNNIKRYIQKKQNNNRY